MRKILIIGLVALLSVVLSYGFAYAIAGVCSNCHTMHNSQNGQGQVRTYDGSGGFNTGVTDPQQYLLKADCIACHTGTTGQTTAGAPIVLHTIAPTGQGYQKTQAGGDFYWVATSLGAGTYGDAYGHNVYGLAAQDQVIGGGIAGYTPPGWHAGATPGLICSGQVNNGGAWSNQLNCAGQRGCHGKRDVVGDMIGIKGAHHANTGLTATSASSPTTLGGSYRFLCGIKGLENSNWNWNESASIHNEYYGVNDTSPRGLTYTTYNNKDTISYSCAECHGYFHSQVDYSSTSFGSPWARHPTDIVLGRGAGTEYSAYNPDNTNQYSVEAPVARPAVPTSVQGSSATVLPDDSSGVTGAIVMCLSCHRAHGSPEPDLLRWTYSGIQAGSGNADTGCFTCHTTKNAD